MNKLVFLFLLVFSCVSFSWAQSANSTNEWSGFYVGGNGFASSDKTDASATLLVRNITNLFVTGRGIVVVPNFTTNFAVSKRKTNGGGGGQAGYQWQAGKSVFGVEGDFNPVYRTFSVSQSQQLPPTTLQPASTINARRDVRLSREFSIRGRGGVAFGKTLIYGTGGFSNARAQVTSIDSFTNPGGLAATSPGTAAFNSGAEGPVVTTANETKNMNGWNVGGGFEQKFGKHLSIGFEYRHTDFRSKTFTLSNQTTINTGSETKGDAGGSGLGVTGNLGSVSTGPTSISLKSDSFGVRVNFHF